MFSLCAPTPSGVCTVTLDRPPANAIGEADLGALARLLAELAGDDRCRVLVFTGTGRFFSAGADIKLMAEAGPGGVERLTQLARDMQAAYDAIERLPFPTIAAINGIATGGGLELALACDLRIAAQNAAIGLTETRIGLIPGAGGTQRLVQAAGRAAALRLVLRGEIVDGSEAARLGIVHEAVPAQGLAARTAELAEELAAQPREALRSAKRCIALAPTPAGYAAEIDETRRLHGCDETRTRIAAFLARRK